MARRMRSESRQPGPSNKRPRLGVEKHASSSIEVIELTDSEDEIIAPIASTKNSHAKRNSRPPASQPSPSKTKINVALAFGKASSEILADHGPASAPGSSQRGARQEKQRGEEEPLFFPGSDDEPRPHPPPPARVPQAAPLLPPPLPPPLPAQKPDVIPQEPPVVPPPPPPPPPESAPVDPMDEYVVRVLEIVPDVLPAHVFSLVEQYLQTQPHNVVELVLHSLFEDPSYPKVDKKGKRKHDDVDGVSGGDEGRAPPKQKIDYTSKDRVYDCGPHYFERSLEQLMTDFPRIPKPYIRERLFRNRFYAPTYFILSNDLKKDPLPFRMKSTNSVVSGKGKLRADPQFDEEREWVLRRVHESEAEKDAQAAAALHEQECEESGEGIECGCCFAPYPFEQMVQCPEAHLFCKTCMTSYASNLLGEHNPSIVCMDQSGCKLAFPESELSRFLSSKLMELYHRVKQRKEIEAAGLENLEECPHCEYRCVIENKMEKLFRCENVDCGAVTCRMCKKPDHLPKSCKEMEEDKHLDAQHIIEEAMTQALMRNCPKCQKSFIKEMGCNKMTCPNCHTVSCYICRKVISGYDHFSNPPPYTGKADKSKCVLWDPVETRHDEEVSKAAKRALEELRQSRPDVDATNIKVNIPVAGPAPRAPIPGVPQPGMFGGGFPPMVGAAMGVNPNPYMFGAGQPHQFGVPPPPPHARLDFGGGAEWGDARADLQAHIRRAEEMVNRVGVNVQPPKTRARGRARAARPAPVPAPKVAVAAGPAGRRRRR